MNFNVGSLFADVIYSLKWLSDEKTVIFVFKTASGNINDRLVFRNMKKYKVASGLN